MSHSLWSCRKSKDCPLSPCTTKASCRLTLTHAFPFWLSAQAWNLYLSRSTSNEESFVLLQLIANECYRVGEYWVAAKAFDMLEKFS